ncbi:hypothetical protein [Allosphingosinicella deserti]|uniref:Uncharacterized protein n=1 Tax=Allosphingosinicella deserti TaxID=2116704 RepID=A0A2P7QW63_9SPHN|nr:hypothetical protein [Sphingomonas deserti]PSJ42206.1 hypothetical protein C7I55_08210 [Sphingomonas deserti]
MADPDGLAALSAEFNALPERTQRAILAALPASERFEAMVMLREATAALPGPAIPTSRKAEATCSEWLLERLRYRSGEEAGEASWTMTSASWTALMEVANGLGIDPAPRQTESLQQHRPTLFDSVARLFTRSGR